MMPKFKIVKFDMDESLFSSPENARYEIGTIPYFRLQWERNVEEIESERWTLAVMNFANKFIGEESFWVGCQQEGETGWNIGLLHENHQYDKKNAKQYPWVPAFQWGAEVGELYVGKWACVIHDLESPIADSEIDQIWNRDDGTTEYTADKEMAAKMAIERLKRRNSPGFYAVSVRRMDQTNWSHMKIRRRIEDLYQVLSTD